jgi:hypothetical protein
MLPTDTVLDLDYKTLLKCLILEQPFVPPMRAEGMSNTDIIDTIIGLVDKGLVQIVVEGETVKVLPTTAGYAVTGRTPRRP